MKLTDVLPQLTILPLRRFSEAWEVKPAIKSDNRDVFEQAILTGASRINASEAVERRLSALERDLDYLRRGNAEMLLRLVVDQPGFAFADDGEFIKRAVVDDSAFHEYARSNAAIRHLDPRTVDIYQSVLEVAWENRVSFDEYQLIKRLQRKLKIGRRDHRVLEIRTIDLPPLGPQEAEQALRDLNYQGFICQFKLRGHTHIVLPEEIALHLRNIYGMSLQSVAYRNLAGRLSTSAIRETLEEEKQPAVSIRKDFLVERLIDGDISPATVLEHVDNEVLDELLATFSDQKPPVMRAVKIRHIVANFDRFSRPAESTTVDDAEKVYYEFLVELASRQYEVLRTASVIQHDQNVDRAFERGVRYAFSNLLGHPAIQFTGNAHADGGITAKNGRMVLWDCKSALRPYALTEAKSAQFLQYVTKETPNIVSPFLVFSCDFTSDSAARALALKANCPPGTEIALMTARDLKWLADRWSKEYPGKVLPLDVLAHSGFLSIEVLELRLKLFAGQAQDK